VTVLNGELLTPIPGENPAGVYLRYDPLYEQIKEARREDDDLPQGDWQTTRKAADWSLVIKLATDALSKKTKDLQIAAWLTEAWLRREGFGGLRRGLELVQSLLQEYWDTVYPEIDDGDTDMRAAPLSWLGLKFDVPIALAPLNGDGHTLMDHRRSREVPTRQDAEGSSSVAEEREKAIAEGKIPPEDIERAFLATPKEWYRALVADIDGSLQLIEELETFCTERFVDPPSFGELRTALRDVRQLAGQMLARKLELEPDAEPVPGTDAAAGGLEAAPGEAPAAAAGRGTVNLAAGPRDGEEAAIWVAAAARKLRQEQPTSPTAYLLLRSLRWGELRTGGGGIDPRLLSAPSTETRTRLRGLLLDASWPELLNAAEEVMAQPAGRGWLDLQRYALTAVAGMGEEYEAVGAAMRGALRTLLADLPDLLTQTLMDDAPAANAETRAWLADEKLLPDGTEVEDAAVAAPTASLRRDVWEVAQARVRAGDARAAMELLMRAAAQEKSARARFLRRAQAAEVMVGAGMEPVALPILRDLLELVETHRLEEWEAGETVAGPMGLLYRCAQRLGNSDVNADSLYERICRLDPIRAIQLQAAASAGNEGE
jgi:type VI secretion system protein ImpA